MYYNEFPNLGFYCADFPNLKGPRDFLKIEEKIPAQFNFSYNYSSRQTAHLKVQTLSHVHTMLKSDRSVLEGCYLSEDNVSSGFWKMSAFTHSCAMFSI